MSSRSRWLALAALAIVVAIAAWAFATQAWLETRIESGIAALGADFSAPRRRSPEGRDVYSRLDEIDRFVRERVGAEDHFAQPWRRSTEEIAGLPGALDELAPFFDRVDALTRSDACRRFLERRECLDMPTRRLLVARTCTNLLCARAWVDQRLREDGAGAARRLGQALDLSRLGDDGSMIGLQIGLACESIVLATAQQLLLEPGADPKALREVLDSRLARASDPERFRRAIVHELEASVDRTAGRSIPSLRRDLATLESAEWAVRFAGTTDAEAEAKAGTGEPQRTVWKTFVSGWQLHRTRIELARSELAVAAGDETLPR